MPLILAPVEGCTLQPNTFDLLLDLVNFLDFPRRSTWLECWEKEMNEVAQWESGGIKPELSQYEIDISPGYMYPISLLY